MQSLKFFYLIIICAGVVCFVRANNRKKRIVGGEPADIPPKIDVETPDPDSIVFVYENDRSARIRGVKDAKGYYSFLGIRYAESPLGPLRLARPVFLYLEGNVTATKYGPPCLQPNKDATSTVGSEDCLYLNVYTPSVQLKRNNTGFPVLFWIHGGGFRRGSASQYGVSSLVTKGITVVTVQYRLGSLGWLGGTSQQIPGNAALFDIRAALEWTRRYIGFFGGDPGRIYTSGQGIGGSVALMLSHSFVTSHMVHGVFAMSGTSVSATAVDYMPFNTSAAITSVSRCFNLAPLQTVRCLQQSTAGRIFTADSQLQDDRLGKEGFISALTQLISAGPVVEGCDDGRFLAYFMNDPPLESLKIKPKKAPLLIGVTKHETSKPVLGPYRNDVLQRLTSIPEFLSRYLPLSLLNNNLGLFTNGSVNRLLQSLFNNNDYLNLLLGTVSTGLSELEKVVEVTTDALFNLPAFVTSALWSKKKAPVYFYSFEHISDNSQVISAGSESFLSGLPLVSALTGPRPYSASDKPTVGHGDDLIYLFDPQTLEGRPIPDAVLRDPRDVRLRELFTNLVAEYLRTGKPRIAELNQEWPTFEPTRAEYVALSDRPRVMQGFRLCQMGLWGGFVDILRSPFCQLPGIDNILSTVSDLLDEGLLSDTTNNLVNTLGLDGQSGVVGTLGDTTGDVTGALNGGGTQNGNGGLLSGLGNTLGTASLQSKSSMRTSATSRPQTTSRMILPLGGLLG